MYELRDFGEKYTYFTEISMTCTVFLRFKQLL